MDDPQWDSGLSRSKNEGVKWKENKETLLIPPPCLLLSLQVVSRWCLNASN